MTPSTVVSTPAIVPTSSSAFALLMDPTSMAAIERVADFMASGVATVPTHLRKNKGDCFAITLKALQWGMDPFAVAQKTFQVNGVLGYEAQLVAAIINSSGLMADRFKFEWFGAWEKIVGKFKTVESRTKKDDDGHAKKYIVPDWDTKDEAGLGVKVWATIKGETEPRVLEILMTQARTRNSTLWTEDPKQQIAYLAQKRWARLHAPDVILGVYTPDEIQQSQPGMTDMGMVDEVTPGAAAANDPATVKKPTSYDAEQFKANLPKWTEAIESGKQSIEKIIGFIHSRNPDAPLTEAQLKTLNAIKVKGKNDGATDAVVKEKAGSSPTNDAVLARIHAAIDAAEEHKDLDALAEDIGTLADAGQRAQLVAALDKKANSFPPF